MNQNLVSSLAQPVNHVAQAYEARTGQLEAKRKEEKNEQAQIQQQRDNDMLKVFEFAGDGRVNEAKYYADSKGLQVPEQVYQNADFAKGLTLAGKIYGDDPAAAQKFTTAWMQNPQGDFQTRLVSAQQAAGVPINSNDREYQRKIAFEMWKLKNIPEKPPVSRFEAGQDAYNEVMGGVLATPEQGDQARQEAFKYWDQEYGSAPGVSSGLTGGGADTVSFPGFGTAPPLNVRNNNPGNMRPVGATTGFQQFSSPEEGVAAMRNDLIAKISGRSDAMASRFGPGYSPTLANVIATWAPPEENNTAAYVMNVSQKTGIGPNQVLTLQDIDRIMPAMTNHEGPNSSGYFGMGNAQTTPAQAQQSQIPSGLPQGSVMIGTANGRPVYQAPNGERFIDDGNP